MKPITAEVVPVKPVVRPDIWLVMYPARGGGDGSHWAHWLTSDCPTESDAREYAATKLGSVIFRLPGSAAND